MQGVHRGEGQEEALGPLLLLDTAGCDMDEQAEDGSGSKFNDGEAQVHTSALRGLDSSNCLFVIVLFPCSGGALASLQAGTARAEG